MYCFATTKADGDEGYVDGRCDADPRANLDFTFDTRLGPDNQQESTRRGKKRVLH